MTDMKNVAEYPGIKKKGRGILYGMPLPCADKKLRLLACGSELKSKRVQLSPF